MMKETHFKWLLDSQWDGALQQGGIYPVSAYGEEIVKEWVKTGAAAWAKPESKKPAAKAGQED